jgi:hypothetical protein
MVKRLALPIRAFGAEPGMPDIPTLTGWVAEHRGISADLLTYRIDQSLAPQLPAGVTYPCAGGLFYADRIIASLTGVSEKKAVDEVGIETGDVIRDACAIGALKSNSWWALPAPHALGIVDTYYNDEDEWNDALTGVYRAMMRAMRDAGIAGHVLIGEYADDAELARLARQKVFFFVPKLDRESLACVLEHQRQVAVSKDQLDSTFDLGNEYELHRIIVMDPDEEAITLALSHVDPDQVMAGGYCTENCDRYWKSVVDAAWYIK